jgi:serine/threonine-protein kinase
MRHPLTGPIRIGNVMIDASTRPSDVFPYEIRRQVGSGSMGVVFEALDPALDRPVAIKTLRASMLKEEDDETRLELRQRFLQEARAAAALSHPGATTIYQVGQLDDEPFIVMEWLAGRTLEQVLGERQRLRVEESLELAISVLDTLEAAHRAGIVHRDVKPSNLLVLDDGRLKVTDFGIASIEGRELVKTRAGVILATPRFAAPEQLRGINVDGRADLFSLGIVLYLMLTGEYPLAGDLDPSARAPPAAAASTGPARVARRPRAADAGEEPGVAAEVGGQAGRGAAPDPGGDAAARIRIGGPDPSRGRARAGRNR